MKTMIEMAHEVYGEHTFWAEDQLLKLKAFEALVRADEREACAEMCDRKAEVIAITGKSCDPDDLAAAIRARGNT